MKYLQTARIHAGLLASLLILSLLGTAACSQVNIENKEAVRLGMVEYLKSRQESTGLDPNAMDVVVNAVAFERDTARASVSFVIKGTDQGMMDMNYTLLREGDKWVVESRQDATVSPHGFAEEEGATPEMPADHPAIEAPAAGGETETGAH